MEFISKHGPLIVSSLAFIVSIFSLYQSRTESILSHRAYVGAVTWDTATPNQFQFSFANSGGTPATEFRVIARILSGGKIIREKVLAEHQILIQGIGSDKYVRVVFNISNEEKDVLSASPDNFIQVYFEYTDYVGEIHKTVADFRMNKDNNYIIAPIRQQSVK